MQVKPEKKRKSWGLFWRIAGITLLVLVIAGAAVIHHLRTTLPKELVQDVRAGIAARGISDPDKRFAKYLEGRYGDQNQLTNREKVFVDFFNPEHIRAMQFLVKHSPPSMRQANIDASAKWVEQFRESLTPDQLSQLGGQLEAGGGNSMLSQATAQYNAQDVYYRGQTAAVVSQLLKTIATVKGQNPGQ